MVYIHIPYCRRRCTYCAFYSQTVRGDIDRYLAALAAEIAARSDGHAVRTLYLGGGTPSTLSARQLDMLFNALAKGYDLGRLEECTLECNPEDLTPQYLADLRALGLVNRLSIGLQSFDDGILRLVNRVHTASTAVDALRHAAEAGFDNLSVDLIYGLPTQTVGHFGRDLQRIATLAGEGIGIRHLSCYALSIEPGTILEHQIAAGRIAVADDDTVAAQYDTLLRWCSDTGFMQYEVSNFCLDGYASKHNSRYWNRTPYTGYGAAAHSFDGLTRRWNVADKQRYIEAVESGLPCHESETLSADDAYNEYLMTALRTTRGVLKSMVDSAFRDELATAMRPYVDAGWIVDTPLAYRPTPHGLLHADGIAASLFHI